MTDIKEIKTKYYETLAFDISPSSNKKLESCTNLVTKIISFRVMDTLNKRDGIFETLEEALEFYNKTKGGYDD